MIRSKSIHNVCVISHKTLTMCKKCCLTHETEFADFIVHLQLGDQDSCSPLARTCANGTCGVSAFVDGADNDPVGPWEAWLEVPFVNSSLTHSMRSPSLPAISQGHLGSNLAFQHWGNERGSGIHTQQETHT